MIECTYVVVLVAKCDDHDSWYELLHDPSSVMLIVMGSSDDQDGAGERGYRGNGVVM